MTRRSRIGAAAAAVLLAASITGAGATVALAATGDSGGCSVTSNRPFKSGVYVRATGSGSCATTASRTLFLELHRSEGFYHPIKATSSDTGAKKNYSTAAQTCDDVNPHVYFTEVRMGDGGGEINSGDSGTLRATC